MRKWMRRARAAIVEPRQRLAAATASNLGRLVESIPVPILAGEVRATALHMRLRERRLKRFVRGGFRGSLG